MGNVST
jgi:hypothetical protein